MNIVTVIPYTDKIHGKNYLGELISNKQVDFSHSEIREININYNRYELQQKLKDRTDIDLVLLMDSDVIASKDELQALLDAFKGDPLALKTKQFDTGSHICCACCLLKFEDYLKIDYINSYVEHCQCQKIMDLFNVTYLEGYSAYEYRDHRVRSNSFHGSLVDEYTEMKTDTRVE